MFYHDIMIKTSCLALLLAVIGCNPPTKGVTPMPPVVTDQNMCEPACQNLQRLTCDEGQPIVMKTTCRSAADCEPGQECSSQGHCQTTCTQFCVDTENQGVYLDPTCVAKITNCGQLDSCPLIQHKN